MLAKLIERAATGLDAIRHGGKAATSYSEEGWSTYSGLNLSRKLPGSKKDFGREAGQLWDNSIVRMALKWKEDIYFEARQCVRRPDKTGKLDILPEHPLTDLLRDGPNTPNPIYGLRTLKAGLMISLSVYGDGYLWKLRSGAGRLAGFLYLPASLVKIVAGGPFGWISHYEYRVSGQTIRIEVPDMIHVQDGADPENPRHGLSRLGAALREICTVNERATFEWALLGNRGIPGAIVNLKEAPKGTDTAPGSRGGTVDQARRMKKQWQEEFTGDNRFMVLASTLPLDVHEIAFSPNEMALDKIARLPISVICGSLNLDPMVLGLPSDEKKFSNFREARSAAYEECIIPTHKLIDEAIGSGCMHELPFAQENDVLGRDYSDVRALQEDAQRVAGRATTLYKGGVVKRKVALRMIGEEYDEVEDDVYSTDLRQLPAPGHDPHDEKPVQPAKVRPQDDKDLMAPETWVKRYQEEGLALLRGAVP